ncbi:MAG TPA: hypothetical protein VKI45_02820 [Allosphingosinicella sp.]|nr:hypothetical protein [Allosphingosinicella sp.]
MRTNSILLAFAATFALAACGSGRDGGNNVAALDNQLVGNETDAALTGALGNQIAVDPAVANGSKSASGNSQEAAKPTAGAIEKARLALNGADHKGCAADAAKMENGNQWAERLPAAFGTYPGAKVAEAAANNANGCSVRVVSLTTSDDWQRVLDWYNTRAVKGGYTTEHRIEGADHVLGGTNDKAGGAYYLIVTPGQGTTEISLIANNGR